MEKILPQTKRIALLGSGISCLTFLYSFPPQTSISIKLFEKNTEITNRARTKKLGNNFCDTGANYLCTEDREILELITNNLDKTELINGSSPFPRII